MQSEAGLAQPCKLSPAGRCRAKYSGAKQAKPSKAWHGEAQRSPAKRSRHSPAKLSEALRCRASLSEAKQAVRSKAQRDRTEQSRAKPREAKPGLALPSEAGEAKRS